MWRHSLSNKTGQAPRPNAIQPWRHVNNPPSLQAKRPQPFGHEHHQSSRVWPVGVSHPWMLLLWGPQPAHWSWAYSFWGGLPIVVRWIGPIFVVPLHFRAHFGPPGFLVPPPQLIIAGLLDFHWVLPTWSLELAYDSSWVPFETPKKWIELNRSSNTTWHTPKSLVSPQVGPKYSSCEIVRDSRHAPNSQH
jgi:hypothetical protein